MSIFSNLKKYASSWEVIGRRSFSPEEIAEVKEAHVIPSQYGMSVCFFMKSGGQIYIPVGQGSSLVTGEVVDLTKVELLTLHKDGECDILRVE